MSFGKKKKIEATRNFQMEAFNRAHTNSECQGQFRVQFVTPGLFSASILGPIRLPCAPYIACNRCKAAYLMPGFQEFLEKVIAQELVFQNGMLTKLQLKFLRQHFGFTQDEFAKIMDIADRHEVSKFESNQFPTKALSKEKQVIFRLRLAKILHIKNADQIMALAEIDELPVNISQIRMPSRNDIEEKFKKAGTNKEWLERSVKWFFSQ